MQPGYDQQDFPSPAHQFCAQISYMGRLAVPVKTSGEDDFQGRWSFLWLSPFLKKPNPARRWTWAFLTDALAAAVEETEAKTHQIRPARTILRNQWETPAHILVVRGQNDP